MWGRERERSILRKGLQSRGPRPTGWRYEWVQTTVLAPPRDSYGHSPRALARLPRRYQAPAYPHWRALAGTHRRIYAWPIEIPLRTATGRDLGRRETR